MGLDRYESQKAIGKFGVEPVTVVEAIMKRCSQKDIKDHSRCWCIYMHDPQDHTKMAHPQPKGWPKHYKTQEDAKKALRMMHAFGSLGREFEKNRTYRIQHGPAYSLFQILKSSADSFQVLDLKTGRTHSVDRRVWQRKLDSGSIYVSV